MTRCTITNQKGGSGKTTTVVNLGAALASKGKKVLIIDFDPQADTSYWLDAQLGDHASELVDAYLGTLQLADFIHETQVQNLSIIPSCKWLYGLHKHFDKAENPQFILQKRLNALHSDTWDYCLIDTAPDLSILTVNALCAADYLIIPVETKVLALNGLARLMETIQAIQKDLNKGLKIAGILPCRVDGRLSHAKDVVNNLRERLGSLIFETEIRENIRIAECPSFHESIITYDKRSKGAEDFLALADEVMNRI